MKNVKYILKLFDTRSGRRLPQWSLLSRCFEMCGIFLMICTQGAVYLKFLETRGKWILPSCSFNYNMPKQCFLQLGYYGFLILIFTILITNNEHFSFKIPFLLLCENSRSSFSISVFPLFHSTRLIESYQWIAQELNLLFGTTPILCLFPFR